MAATREPPNRFWPTRRSCAVLAQTARAIARTCRPHAAVAIPPFTQFQKSSHYALLREGQPDVPSCSTCHGTASGALLDPKGLERQCASCHGPGKKHARPEYAAVGRRFLQSVRDTRELFKQAARMVKRVSDPDRRASLQYAYAQTEVPLIEAVHDGHAFVFDDANDRLAVARRRVLALLDQLAGAPSGR